MRSNRSGFTLVELIVVMIIVSILAAVATPMMTANVRRAEKAEGETVLGALRTAERLVRVETGNYEAFFGGILGPNMSKHISSADLEGKYYSRAGYGCDRVSLIATHKVQGVIYMDLATGKLTYED